MRFAALLTLFSCLLPPALFALPPACSGAVHRTSDSALEDQKVETMTQSLDDGDYYQIDALFLSTSEASASQGGQLTLATKVSEFVSIANTSFYNSGLPIVVRSVGLLDSPLPELSDANDELALLPDSTEIQALRDEHKADIVVKLISHTSSDKHCGVAFILDKMDDNSNRFGYQVTSLHPNCENWVFTHELGHLLGAEHNQDQAGQSGIFPYSFGYKFTLNGQTTRTLMAVSPGSVINYFSSPNLSYQSTAIGTVEADNIRTIQDTMGFVAAYRGESTTAAPDYEPRLDLSLRKSKKYCSLNLSIENLTGEGSLYLYLSSGKKEPKETRSLGPASTQQVFTIKRKGKRAKSFFIRFKGTRTSSDSAQVRCPGKARKK